MAHGSKKGHKKSSKSRSPNGQDGELNSDGASSSSRVQTVQTDEPTEFNFEAQRKLLHLEFSTSAKDTTISKMDNAMKELKQEQIRKEVEKEVELKAAKKLLKNEKDLREKLEKLVKELRMQLLVSEQKVEKQNEQIHQTFIANLLERVNKIPENEESQMLTTSARFAITRCAGPITSSAMPREVLEEILKLWKDKDMIRIVGDVGTAAELVADVLKVITLESTRNCFVNYKMSIELLERTSRRLELLYENPTFDSKMASTTFKSYGAMLRSLMQTSGQEKQSDDDIVKAIEAVELRTILYEFPPLAKVYHYLKMCRHDGNLAYCPLDFYVANSAKCNVTNPDLLKIFMETMRRNAADSEEKCLCSIGNQQSSSGTSTSTQTDGTIPVDPAVQKRIEELENQLKRKDSQILRQKHEIERLEKVEKNANAQISSTKSSAERAERILKKKIDELQEKVNENRTTMKKKLEEKAKEQKKVVDDLRKEMAKLEEKLEEQRKSLENKIKEVKKEGEECLKQQEKRAARLLEEQEEWWKSEVQKQMNLVEEYKQKLEEAKKDMPSSSTVYEECDVCKKVYGPSHEFYRCGTFNCCKQCINEWLQRNPTSPKCPHCRKDITYLLKK